MSYIQNFTPTNNQTITITAGVGAAAVALPTGGTDLLLSSPSSNTGIIFFETFGATPATAAVATSTPILPGQTAVFSRKNGDVTISTISNVAAQTLFVTAGEGG
jgi:hypothetical protein